MNKKTKTILLISGILLLMLCMFIIPALLQRIPPNEYGVIGNSAGNLNNGGLFCEKNGKVYFSNIYDGGSLYSMNPDGSDKKKLNSTKSTQINADRDFIYYYGQNLGKQPGLGYVRATTGIYRTKLNGKSTTSLKQVPVFNLQLIDNNLYFLYTPKNSGGCLSKISRDKKTVSSVTTYVLNPSCAEDGTIYYNGTKDDHYLYALNTRTNQAECLYNGNVWNPVKQGNYIYFMDVSSNYRLCRLNLSENVVEILTEERVELYNVNEVYIYYQNAADENAAIKRMYLDGSGVETIMAGVYTNINLTSQYAYFQPFENQDIMYKTPAYEAISVTDF